VEFLSTRDDVFYVPIHQIPESLYSLNIRQFLVLNPTGNQDEFVNFERISSEVRTGAPSTSSHKFSDGLYVLKRRDEFSVLLVQGNRHSKTNFDSFEFSSLPIDDINLGLPIDYLLDSWASSRSLAGDETWVPGEWAAISRDNRFGLVVEQRVNSAGSWVEVDLAGARVTLPSRDLRKLGGDPKSEKTWISNKRASAEDFTSLVTWAKIKNPLTNTFYSYAASKTVFKPYQFLPSLKMINSERGRLLIADEVGLGKTIEAGLIWAELEQRHSLRRNLIIVPAALTAKWKNELRVRFMRDVPIWKSAQLKDFLNRLSENPEEDCNAIISLETIRGSEALIQGISSVLVDFDLVIIDEAHAVRNRNGKGYTLADAIGQVSQFLIFMSATPLNLGQQDFFNLVNLLEPDIFSDQGIFNDQLEPNKYLNIAAREAIQGHLDKSLESLAKIKKLRYGAGVVERGDFELLESLYSQKSPLDPRQLAEVRRLTNKLNTLSGVLNRTRKVDVPNDRAIRVAINVEVEWSQSERDFYEAVLGHYKEKAKASSYPAGFIMQMPLRQTCSSIPVMQRKLRSSGLGYIADLADSEDLPELNDESVGHENSIGGQFELDLSLEGLATGLEVSVDSKAARLLDELKKVLIGDQKHALIFSFFKGTVEYLSEVLTPSYKVGMLHGGIKPEDREEVIAKFRSGEYDILVANQVGSEGLDFQFCNVLVNYDLPWNPMQVEQRIGRLDRFGQKHERIFIYNMAIPGTIETDIIGRLYERIGIFEDSIGDLEPILREVVVDVSKIIANSNLTDAEKVERALQKAVAIEQGRHNLALIQDQNELVLPGNVEVEGLSESGAVAGRYLGEYELSKLLGRVLTPHGGDLSKSAKEGIWWLHGNSSVSNLVRSEDLKESRSIIGQGHLVQALKNQVKIPVTFDSRLLVESEFFEGQRVELITGRHPLTRVAIRLENEVSLLDVRFGGLRIQSTSAPHGEYLAKISLAKIDGLVGKVELWVTAVNLATGESHEALEGVMLDALAAGRGLSELAEPSNLRSLKLSMDALEGALDHRQNSVQERLQRENLATLNSRREADLQILDRKIQRIQALIDDRKGIESINLSRLAKAATERSQKIADYEAKTTLQVSLETLGIAHVVIH
jgi:superfamily II DNA or RNA helicase